MTFAIEVDALAKRYRVARARRRGERYIRPTLREAIAAALLRPFKQLYNPSVSGDAVDFWALRDINLKVSPGEAVGVIGANGAGKSTLLKILSRITEPTSGEVRLRGRVGSLLEVGTGFHPELSGRENIFLSGAVLGMRRREIRRQLDEIIDFAGVEAFLETPVKRYSSGMRVRLAFAVAAHLQPNILLVDEVLAVGDVAFQKKCLNKMDEVARGGRTVLFVSHHMGAVADLCSRSVHLDAGRIVDDGPTPEVISSYLRTREEGGEVDLRSWQSDRQGDGPLRWTFARCEDEQGRVRSIFGYGEPLAFRLGIQSPGASEAIVGLAIRSASGHVVIHPHSRDDRVEIHLQPGDNEVLVRLPENILNDGAYYVTAWLGDGMNLLHDRAGNCLSFTVNSQAKQSIRSTGAVRLPCQWQTRGAAEPCGMTGGGPSEESR